MAKLSVSVEEKEYDLDIDSAGVPAVGEILGIEVEPGTWRDFKVLSRRFNFGAGGTTVIVQASETGNTEPRFAWV